MEDTRTRENEETLPIYLMNRHNDGLQPYTSDLLSSSRRYFLMIEFSDGQLRPVHSGLSASQVPEVIQGITETIPLLRRLYPNVNPIQGLLLSNLASIGISTVSPN